MTEAAVIYRDAGASRQLGKAEAALAMWTAALADRPARATGPWWKQGLASLIGRLRRPRRSG